MIEAGNAFIVTTQKDIWVDSEISGITVEPGEPTIEALKSLEQYSILSVDIESRNLKYDSNRVLLIGFSYDGFHSIVFQDFSPAAVAQFNTLFDNKDVTFVWQNGKFDTVRLKYLISVLARIDGDTLLQHYAGINERKGTHGLKEMGQIYLQAPAWDDELDAYKKRWCSEHHVLLSEFQYDMIPSSILIPYLYRDTCATFRLYNLFFKLMRPGSMATYNMLIEAANTLKEVELNGCLVDMDYLYKLQDDIDTQIADAERAVKHTAQKYWNPRQYALDTGARTFSSDAFSPTSPKQLKWMLTKALNVAVDSTDKKTLDVLALRYPDNDFVQAIKTLRKMNKYMDTYVNGMIPLIQKDGRVHPEFKLHGTETGRLSCSDPNMQNIPRNKLIKNLFIAPPGYKLIQLDYSQAELRVLAYLSNDAHLCNVYRRGEDLHDSMATRLFGPNFTKEQRVQAKTINFGIPYGRGPGTIADTFHMSYQEAANLIRNWFIAAPGAKAFVDKMRKLPFQRTDNEYTTVFGRTRHYIITSENRNHIENESVNFPISSVASDLTLNSVCIINEWLKSEKIDARIVNTVHDSIIIECIDDNDVLQKVVDKGTKVMSEVPVKFLPNLTIPFLADAEIGHSWGDLEDADDALQQEMDSD